MQLKHSIPFLALLGSLGACNKVLDKTPESSFTPANFYKNASDAEAGLTGAYNSLYQQYYIWDYVTNSDARADNCFAGGSNADNFAIDNFTTTALNGNVLRDWQGLYQGINTANTVLDYVPATNDPAWSSNNRKAQILGEAHFLRAFHYYNLVTSFGDVPLVLTGVAGTNLYPARTAVAKVYDQIVVDLLYADSTLPASSSSNGNNGRATQGAADALLAKVYAQQGLYPQAATYADKVINNGYYSLLGDYASLFDGNHANSSESIFEIQHSSTAGTVSYGPQLMLPFSLTGDTWPKFNVVTNDLMKLYRSEGDSIRLHASVYIGVASDNVAIPPPYSATNGPVPYIYKWKHPNGWSSPDNQIMIRLADIILLKAEALNEQGQSGQAIALVNQVRARVKLPASTASSQTDVRAAILKERRLELAFEGTRWNDLLRAGSAFTTSLMNSQVDPSGNALNYNVTASKLIFPIPQQERDLNKNLTQNADY